MNGGITVIDKYGKDYMLLVGSSIKYNKKQYSLFGGHYEKKDEGVLETSIREFVEECFNIKIKKDRINNIKKFLIKNNLLLDISMRFNNSMVYFISFKTFEQIYNYIKNDTFTLKEKFNLNKFNNNRIWYNKNIVGLNEVEQVEGILLKDLVNANSRKFTSDLANHLNVKLRTL